MTARPRPSPVPDRARAEHVYAPELLPRMQALLADLADIEFAYAKNLDAIRRSPSDPALKQAMRANLQRYDEARRSRYTHQLAALQRQVVGSTADDPTP